MTNYRRWSNPVLLEQSHSHLFTYFLWLFLLYNGRQYGLQSSKCLLSGSSQKIFARPCSRSFIILPFTFGIGISVWYVVQTKIHFFFYMYIQLSQYHALKRLSIPRPCSVIYHIYGHACICFWIFHFLSFFFLFWSIFLAMTNATLFKLVHFSSKSLYPLTLFFFSWNFASSCKFCGQLDNFLKTASWDLNWLTL